MVQTSARLLRLLALFQGRRSWSGADLCGRLEVTPRTLRRDVDRLRSLGYPIHSSSGTAGGYQLGAGATLPPLLLEDDEAVAVAIALRTAAGGVAGIEESSLRALVKLEQVLPSRLGRRVAALHSSIVPLSGTGPTVDAAVLSVIAGACRDHESLRFSYCGRESTPSLRAVEPHQLVHTGRRWYLVAWDTVRRDWRTFRVDRIESRVTTGARFSPRNPPDGDTAAYVARSIGVEPYPWKCRVALHAPLETIAERIPPAAGVLEVLDENRCMLRTGGNSLERLCVYLMLIGVDFEVLEPPEFLDHVRLVAARFARAARGDVTGRDEAAEKGWTGREACPTTQNQ